MIPCGLGYLLPPEGNAEAVAMRWRALLISRDSGILQCKHLSQNEVSKNGKQILQQHTQVCRVVG